MKYPKLELHIAQLEKTILSCRSSFPEKKKKEIYDNLIQIFEKVKASNYRNFDEPNLHFAKYTLDTIFYGIEHLNYKKEKDIPKQQIYCLNQVLKEWIINDAENYFIVISHNNTIDNFYIRAFNEEQLQYFNLFLGLLFSVNYTQTLIQISKPRYLFNDYLGSIPVYHELGHFIDKNYQITTYLSRNLFATDPKKQEFENHYGEYFADIFASQYIGRSAIEPLNYIAYQSCTVSNFTHPSNEMRIRVVDAFLSGTGDKKTLEIIQNIQDAVSKRPGCPQLRIRTLDLTENPFLTLKPIKLGNSQMVHKLFSEGWRNWLDQNSLIRNKYPNPVECCNKINELIKKSIDLTMIEKYNIFQRLRIKVS